MKIEAVAGSVLFALGISTPVPILLGGTLTCIGAAYGSAYFTTAEDRPTIWKTLVAASVIGTLFAMAHSWSPWVSWLHFQLGMGIAGAFSRPAMLAIEPVGAAIQRRAVKLIDQYKTPMEK